ncbi:MAG: biosynthetic arginine decarboxylase [Phycisphaerales bacterium]|nr:biosynthetic arginine decarboxylase [Phycisphaerales bacterium]
MITDSQAFQTLDLPIQCSEWTTSDSESLYRTNDWGQGYFTIDDSGHLVAQPHGSTGPQINLYEVIQALSEHGIHSPILLRFSDILDNRLCAIQNAFACSISENNYTGNYLAAYPIKVNQQHQVVEEVAQYGHQLGFGLEVGSKPELLAVMAQTVKTPDQLIICNGFKDAQYIEAVILAHKLGRQIIPVVENINELDLIIEFAEKHSVRPRIGVRAKLATTGSGRWASSVGLKSKFGLTTSELLRAVETLENHNLLSCLDLLHCHSGSQHQDISTIKQTITELSHVFVQLRKKGAKLTYIDVGGGLGVDYQGARSDRDSSMNYTLEEYASDIVYRIGSVCDAANIEHPTIITECGRAMVAYSSVLIFDIIGSTGPDDLIDQDHQPIEPSKNEPQPLHDLYAALSAFNDSNPRLVEIFHDTVRAREEALTLFTLGYLSLEQRAQSERLFWTTCSMIQLACKHLNEVPEPLLQLNDLMSETYFANFSLFQSLPDSWAIDQLFPIMPIHRLDEEPTKRAILADITCDSDGKINSFISPQGDPDQTLQLHQLNKNQPYFIGTFMVGAYQETLGDLHNLFGDPHAVHIKLDGDNWSIEKIVRGNSISEVLSYVQFNPTQLARSLERECEKAVQHKLMTVNESRILNQFYQSGLAGYTYLESKQQHP